MAIMRPRETAIMYKLITCKSYYYNYNKCKKTEVGCRDDTYMYQNCWRMKALRGTCRIEHM